MSATCNLSVFHLFSTLSRQQRRFSILFHECTKITNPIAVPQIIVYFIHFTLAGFPSLFSLSVFSSGCSYFRRFVLLGEKTKTQLLFKIFSAPKFFAISIQQVDIQTFGEHKLNVFFYLSICSMPASFSTPCMKSYLGGGV